MNTLTIAPFDAFANQRHIPYACILWIGLTLFSSRLHGDPYVSNVLRYQSGQGFAVAWDTGIGYTNTLAVLGPPSRETPGDFGGPVDPFSPPYLAEQLLSIGAGGSVTLAFDTPVFDHPSNPYGLDFILFGNTGFSIINGDYTGGGVTDGSMFGGEPSEVELWVSADDQDYFRINPSFLTRLGNGFPTDGIGDFTLPVNPALRNSDFTQQGYAGIRQHYAGSGGGLGVNLSWVEEGPFLPWVRYLRLDVHSGRLDLDAVSIVSPQGPVPAEKFVEDFASDPLVDGRWQVHGEPSLFEWNSAMERLEVTWDSSHPNSFLYLPLDQTLNKEHSFTLRFTLELDQLEIGVDPEKKFTFPMALGLMHMEEGLRADYYRGSGMHETFGPRGLVEWSYHADSGFGATLSSGFVSLDNQWAMQNTFPLELVMGAVYEVILDYDSREQSLTTTMTENNLPFGPIQKASLDAFYGAPLDGFTEFGVDALVIASYSDLGQPSPEFAGSLLASGWVDQMTLRTGEGIEGVEIRTGEVVTEVELDAIEGASYWLEKTSDFVRWETRGFLKSDQTASQTISDLGEEDPLGFYRVRALTP